MSTPEMGKMWIETVYLQTAIKTDVKNFSGPYAAYFTELMERQKGAKYFIGQPRDMVTGRMQGCVRPGDELRLPGRSLVASIRRVQDDEQGLLQGIEGGVRMPSRSQTPAADPSDENPRPLAARRCARPVFRGDRCTAREPRRSWSHFSRRRLLVYAGFTIYPVHAHVL